MTLTVKKQILEKAVLIRYVESRLLELFIRVRYSINMLDFFDIQNK